jgi:uncharacterized protein YbcC (UPF0753/DUF2309 family)
MKCYADGCENKNCVYLVLAERFIANQKLKVIENAQINANTVKSITNRWSNKMFANLWLTVTHGTYTHELVEYVLKY